MSMSTPPSKDLAARLNQNEKDLVSYSAEIARLLPCLSAEKLEAYAREAGLPELIRLRNTAVTLALFKI